MGFERRRNRDNTTADKDATNRSTSNTARNQQSTTAYQQPNQSTIGRPQYTIDTAEAHFNMQIPDQSTVRMLEQKQAKFGHKLHDWIAEGMPADILGKTRDMKAFRERQAERPPDVPRNIERQNRRSAIRSENATDEPSPAGETDVPEPVRDVLSLRGQSLDPSTQRTMEDRMGNSFGDVRIHAGPAAAEACESINARAFTVGNHIAFNSGEYDPASAEGQHVLAHELTHVRQQTGGAVSLLPQEEVELEIDPDPEREREAEETANRVVKGWRADIRRMQYTDVHVQRMPDEQSSLERFTDSDKDYPPHPVKNRDATFGEAKSKDYRTNFFEAYPWLEGKVVVHHAVEQQAQQLYPGLISDSEMHSVKNLRGIPKDINSEIHLSEIRKEWDNFYLKHETPTRQQLLNKATEIDDKYGDMFEPPVRGGTNE